MLISNDVWKDEWFCSLSQRQKLLYLYLLGNCTKCGVFDLNTRKINFDLSNGVEQFKQYSKDEILSFAGSRIQPIGDTKAIIVRYVEFNWYRGKPLDPEKNPLHRGLQQELARYGLTFDSLNEMAKHKVSAVKAVADEVVKLNSDGSRQFEEWFAQFWKEYPSECPRKVDKKKCHDKFMLIMKSAGDGADHMFEDIMSGLDVWKKSEMWIRNSGQYIKAPLVWLNGQNWNDNPKKGNGNGNDNGNGALRSENAVRTGNSSDIADLF